MDFSSWKIDEWDIFTVEGKKDWEMGIYEKVGELPADPILGIAAEFEEDTREKKVFLAVGVYKHEEGSCKRMNAVYEAEKKILDTQPSKVYLPIEGHKKYCDETLRLVLGEDLFMTFSPRIAKVQSIGGTGALCLGTKFLMEEVGNNFHLSDPTWANHKQIVEAAGGKLHHYPYYDPDKKKFLFEEFMDYIEQLPAKSILILHACCHNPTGIDPTKEKWEKIADVMKQRGLIAFFDSAYQGLGEGLEEDAAIIRFFIKEEMDVLVACSHSKTFGLYAERVGALFVVTQDSDEARKVTQHLKRFIRSSYSNPPKHGISIIEHILHDDEMRQLWEKELLQYRNRLKEIREKFYHKLKTMRAKKDYSFILQRKGMFCFTGLSKEQVTQLREDFGIYMTLDGRLNLSGLNDNNIDYVVQSMIGVGG